MHVITVITCFKLNKSFATSNHHAQFELLPRSTAFAATRLCRSRRWLCMPRRCQYGPWGSPTAPRARVERPNWQPTPHLGTWGAKRCFSRHLCTFRGRAVPRKYSSGCQCDAREAPHALAEYSPRRRWQPLGARAAQRGLAGRVRYKS
mgnify:CR=1 FL=1